MGWMDRFNKKKEDMGKQLTYMIKSHKDGYQIGGRMAERALVNYFDSYRMLVYAFMICLVPYCIYMREWGALAIVMISIHFQGLFNQLYWRMASIQYYLEKEEERREKKDEVEGSSETYY